MLAPGWTAEDDGTGNIYYRNSSTGVTQWEKPQSFRSDGPMSPMSARYEGTGQRPVAVIKMPLTARPGYHTVEPVAAPTLSAVSAPAQRFLVTKKKSAPHSATEQAWNNATTTIKAAQVFKTARPRSTPSSPRSTVSDQNYQFAGNWEQLTDASGNVYYYNSETERSQWEVPEGFSTSRDSVYECKEGGVDISVLDPRNGKTEIDRLERELVIAKEKAALAEANYRENLQQVKSQNLRELESQLERTRLTVELEMKSKHADTLAKMETVHRERLREEEARIRSELDRVIERERTNHEAELLSVRRMQREDRETLECKMEAMCANHAAKIIELQSGANVDVSVNLEKIKAAFATEKDELIARLKSEATLMCTTRVEEVKLEMGSTFEAQVNKMKRDFELEREEWRVTVEELNSKHQNTLREIESRTVESSSSDARRYEAEANTLRTSLLGSNGQIVELKSILQEVVSKKQSDEKRMMDEIGHLQSKIKDNEAAEMEEKKKLKLQISELLAKADAQGTEIERLKKEKSDYTTKMNAEMEGILTEANKAIEAACADGEAALANLKSLHQKEKDEMLLQSSQAVSKAVSEVRANLGKEIEKATEKWQQLFLKEEKARKALHNKVMELQGNIRVYCRVRPVLDVERKSGEDSVIVSFPGENEINLLTEKAGRPDGRLEAFEFDRVFDPKSTQADVYSNVDPYVISVMDGYNVCIFAYGQTGSGKTHTMEGSPTDRGMTFRALSSLFEQSKSRSASTTYSMSISLLEVYNEQIRDLLMMTAAGSDDRKLDIHHSPIKGTEVVGLTQLSVNSEEEVIKAMERGNKMRTIGGHSFNERSSRSHMVFTIYCSSKNIMTGKTTMGKLHLIDLAGSERVGKTAATGDRLKEAQAINKSLSALADVITALGDSKAKHVPYRNSKLTFLLQDSLEGNSKCLMFVNCSPVLFNQSETKCSLQFAERCRNTSLGVAKKTTGSTAPSEL
jgi:hypothetical protein